MDTSLAPYISYYLLVPEDLRKELESLQICQDLLLRLLYDQRKYQRHCPDLGLAIWFGRVLKQLEKTEKQIDRVQQEIKSYIQIQDN